MDINFWQFLAGLGFFLLALTMIEDTIKDLSGRSFKMFLKKYTRTPLRGIVMGAITTAILQSSSVVTLMVLAFVGASILSLKNSLGIIIGSNLGTTFTGWLVTLIGFKLNLKVITLPFITVGALGSVFAKDNLPRLEKIFKLLLGLGLLLFGLSFMQQGVEAVKQQVDFTAISNSSRILFWVFGIVFTALIQSSSAAMVITLSALHAGLIDITQAMSIAIGADLGTTITVIIGSLKGSSSKKQVALAHFSFNLVAGTIAFILLDSYKYIIQDVIGITDPLYAVVAFHSAMNLVGICIFFPFIKDFAKFLKSIFPSHHESSVQFISETSSAQSDLALLALEKEFDTLLIYLIEMQKDGYGLIKTPGGLGFILNGDKFYENYHLFKKTQGEILKYSYHVQQESLSTEEGEKLARLLRALNNLAHSAKAAKDVHHNISSIKDDVSSQLHELWKEIEQNLESFYAAIESLTFEDTTELVIFEQLSDLLKSTTESNHIFNEKIFKACSWKKISDSRLATLMIIAREIYSSQKSLILGIKDRHFNAERSEDFQSLPQV
ncbi:MAG: Na/Pi cotransporter family protein [Bacteriovoracaceae bacterium]|jgi:phosphate:Na+ symporter|nr:Na/Pi cotransporter family protein [Bacteriovoracaceae bacterium]